MTAKKYLEQLNKIDRMISNKLTECEKLYETITNVTVNTDTSPVQTSKKDNMAEIISKIVDLKEEINDAIEELIDKQREIVAVIEKVENAEMYDILHKYYVQHKPLTVVACEMNYSYENELLI